MPKSHFWNPLAPYTATSVPLPRLGNTPALDDLLRDGKIYLSLSDAITLALENNYDIAIARINLDIADTDMLRARAGSTLRGVSTGLVTNTLGGGTSTMTGGGGPGAGGTSSGSGGGGTGANGLVLSTNGGGPTPEVLDPTLTGQLEYQAQTHALVERAVQRRSAFDLHGYLDLQLRLQAGIPDGNAVDGGLQQHPGIDRQSLHHLQPRLYHELHSDGDAASAAGLRHGHQRAVHPAGEERPADYGLGVPAAAACTRSTRWRTSTGGW